MLRAIEAHVLKEVSETALLVLFLDGTHTLCNVKLCPVFGPVVVTDVVSQSIGQFTDAYIRIDWYWRHLRKRSDGRCNHQYDNKKFLHFF